jgi:hypothetical protein
MSDNAQQPTKSFALVGRTEVFSASFLLLTNIGQTDFYLAFSSYLQHRNFFGLQFRADTTIFPHRTQSFKRLVQL